MSPWLGKNKLVPCVLYMKDRQARPLRDAIVRALPAGAARLERIPGAVAGLDLARRERCQGARSRTERAMQPRK